MPPSHVIISLVWIGSSPRSISPLHILSLWLVRMPSAPDHTPADIAYASRRSSEPWCEPPLDTASLTSEAAYDRLNRIAARKEMALLTYVDHLAVNGIISQYHLDLFERSSLILWRMTAVRKSLVAIESMFKNSPKTPTPDKPVTPEITVTSAEPSLNEPNTVEPGQSSPDTPQTQLSEPIDLPSEINNTQLSQSEPCIPHLSVHAVPSCPTLSLASIGSALEHIDSDLAQLPGMKPSAFSSSSDEAITPEPAAHSAIHSQPTPSASAPPFASNKITSYPPNPYIQSPAQPLQPSPPAPFSKVRRGP